MLFLLPCDSSLISKEAEANNMHFRVLSGLLLLSQEGLPHTSLRSLFSAEVSLPEIQNAHDTYPYLYHSHALRTEDQMERQTRDRLSPHQALLCMAPVSGADINS